MQAGVRISRGILAQAWCIFVLTCAWGISGSIAQALPDLVVNRNKLAKSIEFRTRYFPATDCAVVEGCVGGPGLRRLLMISVGIANIGSTDLTIGDPEHRPDLFELSACHGHYHMKDLAAYKLLNLSRTRVMAGSRKQGFCLRDDRPYLSGADPSHGYNCGYQGITVGWQDVYDKSLDCQWIDITGVPRGSYLLKVKVNPTKVLPESNYRNNAVLVPVTIP